MNISLIEDAITILESDDTTVDNVAELASLYIVRANYKQAKNETVKELNEILPAYSHYIEMKTLYQTGKQDANPMVDSFKMVCKELRDFIITLYSGTDTYKERRELKAMLKTVLDKMK